jgi:tetratricopeptide (TPR) repeat protein
MISRKEQALTFNLHRLSKLLGADHMAVADAWVSLGLNQLESGQAEVSESSFRKALAIRRRTLEETDETITQIHYYIGRTYFERGDYVLAQQSYEKCLDSYENECRPEDAFLASVLDALASLHHDRDKFGEAESYLKRSLFIRLCVLEPLDPAIAESLNHLGWLYSQNGQYQKAENLFLSALDIWVSNFGLRHASTTMCLENYAHVLRKTGRVKEANQLLDKVESIRSLNGSGSLESTI